MNRTPASAAREPSALLRSPAIAPTRSAGARHSREAPAPGTAALGNQALQQLLPALGIQCRLAVTGPADASELEAERIAREVMARPAPAPASSPSPADPTSPLQRVPASSENQEERRKATPPAPVRTATRPATPAVKPPEPKPAPEPKPERRKEDESVRRRPASLARDPDLDPDRNDRDDDDVIQRDAAGPGTVPAVSPALEQRLDASRGGGHPIPEPTRRFLESRFGHDFRPVRLHTDSDAQAAARELRAQAFTRGRDIYFGAGQYQPDSETGRHLLAHELAHTIQQGAAPPAAAATAVVNSVGSPPPSPPPPARVRDTARSGETLQRDPDDTTEDTAAPGERVDRSTTPPSIRVPVLHVPLSKRTAHPTKFSSTPAQPLFRAANYRRGNPAQATKWDREVSASGIATKLRGAPFNMQSGRAYLLRPKSSVGSTIGGQPAAWYARLGGPDEIAGGLKRPFWWPTGRVEQHQVDHIAELQMTGWPRNTWANEIPNMEMLNAGANTSSGGKIQESIEAAIERFLANPTYSQGLPANRRSVAAIKTYYDVRFDQTRGEATLDPPGGQASRWSKTQIEDGTFLEAIQTRSPQNQVELFDLGNARSTPPEPPSCPAGGPYSPVTPEARGFLGTPTFIAIYSRASGGGRIRGEGFNWEPNQTQERDRQEGDPRIRGFAYSKVRFDPTSQDDTVGELRGRMYVRQSESGALSWSDGGLIPWPIKRVPGALYAGYLDTAALRQRIQQAVPSSPHASPITLDETELDDRGHLVSRGLLGSTIPLFRNLNIDLVLDGDDLRLEKAIDVGDFNLPRPLAVHSSSLVISLGTESGLGAAGRVEFGIDRVGEGYVEGRASTGQGLYLAGGFNFDSRIFNPAEIAFTYENRQLTGTGRLGIPEGKLRGIRSATIDASYREGHFEAHGNATFSIPGVEQGALNLVIDETEGLRIDGRVELARNIPGLRGGSLEAEVRQAPDSDEYHVRAHGRAQPAIPGVPSELDVTYEDGAFDARFTGQFARGMMSGNLLVGATNREVDDQGNPTGPPGTRVIAYGNGSVRLQLTPWLAGTVGVRILPVGELELSGEIALPASLEVFPRRSLERNIFSLNLDIPIVGVAVAGQRIGIFATIGGGLDAEAGFGPGQLRDTRLGIRYNPAHEEDTTVTGHAEFYVPANAGLRLFVRGGLGAGIPIVSATANLELGGQLGIEGAATAAVDVGWSPRQGLALDAEMALSAQPKFKFDITGSVLVEADLLLTTIQLYEKRWTLAQFEYGSDLRFGVRFPIHYREGQPFDVSLSDLQFEVPEINPRELLGDLMQRLA